MVVETRAKNYAQAPLAEVGSQDPSGRQSNYDDPPASSFTSVSGSSTASQVLAIQADYATKIAAMERAALERERIVMEKERAALELQTKAQIAAIQDSRSNRSSSRLSKKDIAEWLDKAFDSNIPNSSVEVVESPPNVTDEGVSLTSVNVERSATVQKSRVFVVGTRPMVPTVGVTTKPTFVGSARPPQPLPCTSAQSNFYRSTNTHNESNNNSFNDNVVDTTLIKPNSSCAKISPTSSDIAQLAQAITSLAGSTQGKPKVGDGRLPIFDGRPIDWLAFKRAFDNSRDSYTPSDNIARIGMALKGAARDAVSILLVSARDPHELIAALEMRFGRPELIVLQEIASVRTLPKLVSDGSDLHRFACRVRNCVEVIKLLDEHAYLESPELFQSILSKLTPLLRTRWTDFGAIHFTPRQGKSKLELLATFLTHEVNLHLKFGLITEPVTAAKKVERVHAVSISNSSKIDSNKNKSENHKIICTFCKQNHFVDKCDKFISLAFNDRWQFVKENKLCHKCLKKGSHSYRFCKNSKEICTEHNCFRKHHRLLHDLTSVTHVIENQSNGESDESGNSQTTVVCSGEQSSNFVAHADSHPPSRGRPLLKIIAVTVSGPKGTADTYALLDDGSSSTFIDSELSTLIGAEGPKSTIQVNCVGGLSKPMEVEYVDFNIKGRFDNTTHKISGARAVAGLNITPQTLCLRETAHFDGLRDKLCLSYENVRPMVLLGIDNWHLTIPQKVRKGVANSQPVACLTALGWVVFGFTNSRTKTVEFVNHSVNHSVVSDGLDNFIDLENTIRDYYKLDSIGITKRSVQSSADDRAVAILENTTCRLPDGQFETGLLWRSDDLVVPESYCLALSRLLSLEKKFVKDEAYAKHYQKNIHAMIDKGYAELCDRQSSTSGVTWYLPHFGVTNPNKPGKLRVVHDAAAKCQGVSLNSLLLKGPDLLQSLFGILLRFREGKIALTADIMEMFPQIKIREADRDAQRFLWRDSQNLPISTFRMSSMMFGAASSPFTALYLKNKNAMEYKTLFPEAAQGIILDTYMDDFISSVNSVEEAAKLAKDVVYINSQAHFVIRSWASNEEAALLSIPSDLRLKNSTAVDLGQLPQTVRTLGMTWDTKNDTLGFNFGSFEPVPRKLTKRAALSNMMRVFDPLGILTPLIIRARIIFQKIWRSGVDWDQELPQYLRVEWEHWTSDIVATLSLNIPRWYLIHPQPIEQELHVFCDASEEAYSTVAYWRFLYNDGSVQLAFISSKSRVAPLKPTSIPRLELQAGLIAARLAYSILEASRIKPIRRFYWTDLMTVLGWLRNDARRYKPFVAHRVGEIIELTEIIEWRWVPGDLNVADDATRVKCGPLTLESRWIIGPSFLLSSDWPIEPATNSSLLELKSSQYVHLINDEVISRPLSADPRRFSSWLRLLRATGRAHQYVSLLRLKALQRKGISIDLSCKVDGHLVTFLPRPVVAPLPTSRHNLEAISLPGTLSSDDLYAAKIHILRKSQQDSFSQELRCIHNNQPVSRRSRLSKLPSHLDKDNLLRLTSRIAAVTGVEEEVKSPIILDGKHPAVRLLVLHHHCKAAHANTELVVNEIRQQYWILSLRSTVRSVAYRCQVCQLRRASTTIPIMGALPEARMAHHQRAFSFVGLDYFGPITVSIGRKSEKRYVALYTCLTVRAVHFEVVFSLTTDAAIMSLRRFIARRGTPREIISDNGTAFVGASRVLRSLYGEAVSDFAACQMIKWKFLPPSAPFMAGATERLVKSAKIALKATLSSRSPSDEVLATLLCEAEALINSRPLTHVACDPDHPEALTPNHFLLGGYSSGQPFPAVVEDRDMCSRAGWRKALRLSDFFWQRWMKEYLPVLSPSHLRGQQPSWSIGDMVLVADGNLPRGSWPKGLITALYPGRDGVTRVVDVTTPAGVLRRPIRKVIRLPV